VASERGRRLLACALGAGAVLAGAPSPAPAQAALVRLVVGVPGPLADHPAVEREVRNLHYPTLTALDPDTLEAVPGVAESWSPLPGGTWVYTVREGATWSDGTPVTAEDVAYSVAQARGERPGLGARALDTRRVVVADRDAPGALPTLLVPVLPRHAYESDPTVGGGDWHVVSRTDSAVTLRVVDRPGRPPVDEIVFRSYAGGDALLDALADGEVDVAAAVPPELHRDLVAVEGASAIHANDGDQWVLRVRLPDRQLRRVVARAVDREALVEAVASGVGGTAPVPVVARAARWRLDDEDADALAATLAFDPAARAPARAAVTLAAPPDAGPLADAVVGSLRDAGFTVARAGGAADLELVRRDPGDDPAPALAAYTCAPGRPCDAEYDAAFERLVSSSDPTVRADAVHEMVRRLATEALEVVLFAPHELQAYRTDRVTGMLREPDDERLVVFWPSVLHYRNLRAAQTPGGEDIPDAAFAAIAAGVGVASLAALAVAARARRHRLR
jgi:peptide/nickel transport system substrate-binding protein